MASPQEIVKINEICTAVVITDHDTVERSPQVCTIGKLLQEGFSNVFCTDGRCIIIRMSKLPRTSVRTEHTCGATIVGHA